MRLNFLSVIYLSTYTNLKNSILKKQMVYYTIKYNVAQKLFTRFYRVTCIKFKNCLNMSSKKYLIFTYCMYSKPTCLIKKKKMRNQISYVHLITLFYLKKILVLYINDQ